MAKTFSTLVPLAAGALLLISTAIATEITGNLNQGRQMSSRCERQVRPEKIEHCQQHLRSEIRMIMYPNAGNQACCLRECCDMLQELDDECVCEVMESLVEEMRERMMLGGERGMERMLRRKAMQLPRRCGLTTQGCDYIAATTF